eukprot:COSAG05_NODE_4549_length_1468_cov_1.340394_1_plen_154_part_00
MPLVAHVYVQTLMNNPAMMQQVQRMMGGGTGGGATGTAAASAAPGGAARTGGAQDMSAIAPQRSNATGAAVSPEEEERMCALAPSNRLSQELQLVVALPMRPRSCALNVCIREREPSLTSAKCVGSRRRCDYLSWTSIEELDIGDKWVANGLF